MNACEELDRLLSGGDVEVVWHGLTATQWRSLVAPYRERAEKAEARADALFARLAPSVEYAEGTACGYGDDEIDRLQSQLDAIRAERDRYLAAIVRLMKGPLVQDMFDGWDALRRIAEEAK